MKGEADLPLLLDTHVWLWVVRGSEGELGTRASAELRRGSREGRLLVSIISIWEVAMLNAQGRMRVSGDIEEWVERALAAPGIRLAELTPAIAVESTRLPGPPHRDPADRILIATARRAGARLVTRDARILAYARAGHLRILDATP